MTQEGCSWPGDAELEVHRRISLFGLDPVDTLRFLGKTGSFISGSVPVPVLAGIRFVPNDIDFYCPEKAEAEFQEWLVDQQGFELTRSIEQKYPATRAIKEMTWYVKDGKVVNVMSVRGDSPALAMPQFHSTIVMNMICYKGLYCAYPKLTRRRLSLRVDPSRRNRVGRARADECIEKYTGRGVRTSTTVTSVPSASAIPDGPLSWACWAPPITCAGRRTARRPSARSRTVTAPSSNSSSTGQMKFR